MSQKTRLRIVFMGTPDFAVPALEAIIDGGHEVVAVYTQPPRPKGRGQQVQPSPVQAVAEAHNLIVHTPLSLKKDKRAQEEFAALGADIAIVAAYGLILPPAVLRTPLHGCLNIHASLLPRWRGASPIQHAIWAGDKESGVTIMQMEEGLDTGPMIEKHAVALRAETTARRLHDELSALGAAMIANLLKRLASGEKLEAEPQDAALATYAPTLSREDGRIVWTRTASEIDRQLRAFNPWPGTWTAGPDNKRFKIIEAEPVDETFTEAPGTLVDYTGHVACGGDTALRLIRIQPENAKPMDVVSAFNGHYLIHDMLFT
jgi:methionyl-tRNA formyltransferase